MDEREAEQRARQFVRRINPTSLPVDVSAYARAVGAIIKEDVEMPPGESGSSFVHQGKRYIVVNANEVAARRRFTICHEIAHLELGLPSEHEAVHGASAVKRAPNEIACDVFAAELLMPSSLAMQLVRDVEPSLKAIEVLARNAMTSFPCAGSRFAAFADYPCAFVFCDAGLIRYAILSTPLRQASGRIDRSRPLAIESLAATLRSGGIYEGPCATKADIWLSDWTIGGSLMEDARHDLTWDQTFALLWLEEEDLPQQDTRGKLREGDQAFQELDGILPWPGKRRRK